jgi:HAMP domain-containing protein
VNAEVIHMLGLIASIWLLLILLLTVLVLAALLFVTMRVLRMARRRLERALRRVDRVAHTVELGAARSARAAASPLIFGHRVAATARAAWRRATGPVRAWRGAR